MNVRTPPCKEEQTKTTRSGKYRGNLRNKHKTTF
jgi:hypothetical protein